MPHRLAKPNDPDSTVGMAPMTATLRHQCACGNRELLAISAVFSATAEEEVFIYTMRQLWRDMQTEIRQHLLAVDAGS